MSMICADCAGERLVKAKTLLLFILVACTPTASLLGQIDCTKSSKLACEFPISAVTLEQDTVGAANSNQSVNAKTAVNAAANAINGSIATQLTQLPVPSATVGTVTVKSKDNPLGVAFDNLGPILTDRPDTVGRRNYFVGFSFQHFNFNAIDGVATAAIPVGFSYSQANPFNSNDLQTFYGSDSNSVAFTLDQTVGVFTYGVTKTTDISVVVPYNSVNLTVSSSKFQAFVYDQVLGTYSTISTPTSGVPPNTGSKNGIGDVTLNIKQMLAGGESPAGGHNAIAAGVVLRLPTGDSLDYLGAGAFGANVYGLFEYRARLAPHLKVSYQYNANSQLVKLSAPSNTRLPGGLQYAMGADVKVKPFLTLAGDVLGSQFVNTPSFTQTPIDLIPPTHGEAPAFSIPGVTGQPNTYTTVNLSGGVKVAVKDFLFYGNVLGQINNVGLRSNLVPLFGIAYKRVKR